MIIKNTIDTARANLKSSEPTKITRTITKNLKIAELNNEDIKAGGFGDNLGPYIVRIIARTPYIRGLVRIAFN
jgi:hypothetical protein